MPVFTIETPAGKKLTIEAGDEAQAIAGAQQWHSENAPKPAKASFLPLSKDASGNVTFDLKAGILGSIFNSVKSAVTLPGDVAAGRAQLPSSGAVPGSVEFGDPQSAGPRVADLAMLANPVNPAVRAGDKMIPGAALNTVVKKPVAPTAEALKDAAEGGYKAAGEMGVEFSAPSVSTLGSKIQGGLEKDGVFDELAPKTFSILKRLQNPPPDSVATLANIDTARKALGRAAGDFTNKTEQLAAKRAIEGLDDFLMGGHTVGNQSGVVAGPAAAAGKTIKDARGNYAAAMRSNKITGELDDAFTGAVERAELNAKVANSGQNVDNAIRQRIRDILVRPKEARGYSAEELAQMERVARGSLPTNIARGVGNLLGGGGGLGAALTAAVGASASGAAGAGPIGIAAGASAPLVGYGSKKVANALTRRQAAKLDELIRQRSPLYEQSVAHPGTALTNPERDAAVMRALMLGHHQQ